MFKQGDTIRRVGSVTSSHANSMQVGKQYTVRYCENDAGDFWQVSLNETVGWWDADQFELVRIHIPADAVERKVGDILFNAPETNVTDASGGSKGQKPLRYDLIPWQSLAEVAFIYAKGAEKYGANNYAKGYPYSSSLAALQRHLEKFKSGADFDEDFDGDIKPHHLAAVCFHAMTLMFFQAEEKGTDDRTN